MSLNDHQIVSSTVEMPTPKPGTIATKHPVQVERRNARERNRVRQVNMGFVTLRDHVPAGSKNKKLSKVETLRQAAVYIKYLQEVLSSPDSNSVNFVSPPQIYYPETPSPGTYDLMSSQTHYSQPQYPQSENFNPYNNFAGYGAPQTNLNIYNNSMVPDTFEINKLSPQTASNSSGSSFMSDNSFEMGHRVMPEFCHPVKVENYPNYSCN